MVERVKIQNNVHNKGIIVDGETVLVSSQNWSAAGTLHNRDAGVVDRQPRRRRSTSSGIFLHDWEHLATQHVRND